MAFPQLYLKMDNETGQIASCFALENLVLRESPILAGRACHCPHLVVRSDCTHHRHISLVPLALKQPSSATLPILYNKLERQACEEQAGSRSGSGCVAEILAL